MPVLSPRLLQVLEISHAEISFGLNLTDLILFRVALLLILLSPFLVRMMLDTLFPSRFPSRYLILLAQITLELLFLLTFSL